MTLPTSYTSATIVTYMQNILDVVKDIVSISTNKWDEVANDVLVMYGVTEYTSITDITKVRAIAKMLAWKTAMEAVSAWYNFSADGGRYDRKQIWEMCKDNYQDALDGAMVYDSNYVITIGEIVHVQNPYTYDPDRLVLREEV